jgi:uncharacterized protein with HEPN domain
MKDQPRLSDYLHHIVEAIDRIFLYTEDIDEPSFLSDVKTQDAVIRNFEVIGEAARNIERHYPPFAATHPDIPWGDAYLLRNQLAHGYFKIDLEIVWRTINADLPAMKLQVLALIQQTDPA